MRQVLVPERAFHGRESKFFNGTETAEVSLGIAPMKVYEDSLTASHVSVQITNILAK